MFYRRWAMYICAILFFYIVCCSSVFLWRCASCLLLFNSNLSRAACFFFLVRRWWFDYVWYIALVPLRACGANASARWFLQQHPTADQQKSVEKKTIIRGNVVPFFVCVCCFFSGPPFVCRSLCAFATDASRMRATKKKKTAVTKSTGRYVDTAWSSAIFRTHRRCSCPISTTYLLIWAETRDVKYPQLCSDRGEQFIFFFSSFDSVVRAKIAGVRAASHIEVVHLFETFSGNLYEGARMTYVTVNYWLIE